MAINDAKSVRVTITLQASVYARIKLVGRRLGLRPATWISMVATSKANDLDDHNQTEGKGPRLPQFGE